MRSCTHRATAALAIAFVVALAGASPRVASAQQLGDVICSVDAAFEGTIVAIRQGPAAQGTAVPARLELTVRVDRVIRGSGAGDTLRLGLATADPGRYLREGATRVFLLSKGRLVRVEPGEHAAIVGKLLADPSTCRR